MKFRLILKSFKKNQIIDACNLLTKTFNDQKYKNSRFYKLPTKIKRFCVLRSPHVDKTSREHFEIKIFKRAIDIVDPFDQLDFNSLLNINLPIGVSYSIISK